MNDKINRKLKEYEMKIVKMAGYITDYYIDRAIETDDYSVISGFLIDYFSGSYIGTPFDVGYLVSKYKEFLLNEKIEDIDFNIDEWYSLIYEKKTQKENTETNLIRAMSDEDYTTYMIEKRQKEK